MFEVRDLSFAYERSARPVLVGISFVVASGELVAIIGPNGSGKTTLLRLMCGLLRPQRGQVLWDGKPLTQISPRELAQQLGVVLQEPKVGFPITALEYVLQARFPYSNGFGFEDEEDVRIALSALRLTRALEFWDRKLAELSGGERQRVILARALAGEPRALLLDEPMANLDVRFQVELLALIRRLTRERGLATVFIAHELNVVAEFADRVLLLKDGRTLAFGPPHEVLTEALLRQAFEAEFLVDRHPLSGAPRITLVGPISNRRRDSSSEGPDRAASTSTFALRQER
ncbi:MAG: ABC transporter ATP-binding protein [Blastocatellia bacterium]|nr:ABC transporter ATP-binding protein [Blastocatellia bacterium]